MIYLCADNMAATISIIIPVFNAESTLGACVSSILAQTFRDYEVILVDDGSSDRSADICHSLCREHSNFKALQIAHSGPSAARNAGIDATTGQYITFIDSDDEVDSRYLQTMLDIITRHDADVAALSYQIVARGSKPKPVDHDAPIRLFDNREAVTDLLYQNHLDSSQCFKLIRRSLLYGIRFPEQYRVYEDLLFIYNVYSRCRKVAWTDRKMYFYHKEAAGQMDSVCPQVDDALHIVDDIRNDLSVRFPGSQLLKAIDNRTISISFNLLKRIAQHHISNPEIEKRCWDNILDYRLENLLDRNVRIKNKVGVLLSYLGKSAFTALARLQR